MSCYIGADSQRSMWADLRARMVEHIICGCDDILGLAKQLAPEVTKFESHPLSIADIREVMPRKNAKVVVSRFTYDDPIPDLPEAPRPRCNRWEISIYFQYTRDKFKLLVCKKDDWVFDRAFSFSTCAERVVHVRKNTSLNDLRTDKFLYYLRDLIGVSLKKIKHVNLCGALVDIHDYSYKLKCGNGVRVKGAMCAKCRAAKLKRKYSQI